MDELDVIVGLIQDAQYSEVKGEGAAAVLPAVPTGRGYRGHQLLRALSRAVGGDRGIHSSSGGPPRSQSSGGRSQDVGATGSGKRLSWTASSESSPPPFAVLATLLAAIGLYGVLAYTITQRTREFGLRMALGADRGNVRGMVLRQVGRMALLGGVIGLAAAIALGRLARSMLYEARSARSNGFSPSRCCFWGSLPWEPHSFRL